MRIPNLILAFIFLLTLIFTGCKDDDPKPFKQKVNMNIIHIWKDTSFHLNTPYYWEHDFQIDTITPKTLIYHINNLVLTADDNQSIPANEPYYMVDFGANTTLPSVISFTTPKEGVKYYVNALEFTIGVRDSITNAKNLLASTFVNTMYWGMTQGYINFKFEAVSPQVPKTAINYHIGGYTKPYYNSRKIKITFDKPYLLNESNNLEIKADLFKLFKSKNEFDIRTFNEIHSPNDNSILVADNIAELFSFGSIK